jgi:hypothetical protein
MKVIAIIVSFFVLLWGASGAMNLSGHAGKEVLADLQTNLLTIQNSTDLWSWGSAPAGHIINDSQLIEGAWIEPTDISSMESPYMADYQFAASGKQNYAEFVSPAYYQLGSNGFGSNVKGVFDCTGWKQPGECATTAVQY